jgi:hypothetical protein
MRHRSQWRRLCSGGLGASGSLRRRFQCRHLLGTGVDARERIKTHSPNGECGQTPTRLAGGIRILYDFPRQIDSVRTTRVAITEVAYNAGFRPPGQVAPSGARDTGHRAIIDVARAVAPTVAQFQSEGEAADWVHENMPAKNTLIAAEADRPRAVGRKVSDEYTVPVCRLHHRDLHTYGDEASWWAAVSIDPLPIALQLWRKSRSHPR